MILLTNSVLRGIKTLVRHSKVLRKCESGPQSLEINNKVRFFSVSPRSNMKLVQFSSKEAPTDIRVGYIDGDNIVDLNKADNSLESTLIGILKKSQLQCARKIEPTACAKIPLKSVRLEAPIHGMDKVICIGLNYKDHCAEQNLTPPEVPMFFSKFASCVIGPNDCVKLRTQVTRCVDWEVELVIVIGKEASNVKADDAYSYIMGYTIAQDISGRDWQKKKNSGQFLLGKAMDTFCPIGPWIVTADEIPDPQNLKISCSIDGVLKQSSNTCQLLHKIPPVIERLTSVMTLLPGDIILTGTPGGVGMYRDPPEYLKPGTLITSEIESIGTLTTKCVDF